MSRIHDALRKAEEEKGGVRPEGVGDADELATPRIEGRDSVPAPLLPSPAAIGRQQGTSLWELDRTWLARCPQSSWKADPQKALFFNGKQYQIGTEEFRTLRSHLYLLREQQPLQKVLITSPLSGEGKTFVAANLAQAMVRLQDRRALLIDADLRCSRLHLALGAAGTPGLADYLSGEADEYSVVQRGPLDNLFFIPGGKSVSSASELIGNGRLRLLLQRLAPAFDWVILDSPPAIPVSDARLLADICDGVLIVIQAGSTPFDMAQKACQDFRDKRLLGVVLNRVEAGSSFSSYYYYDKSRPQTRRGAGKAKER